MQAISSVEEFEQTLGGDMPVVVDFYTTWCGPCRMLEPVLNEVAAEKTEVTFCKVDGDKFQDLVAKYSVTGFPTLVFIKDGNEIDRQAGLKPKEALIDWINKHLS